MISYLQIENLTKSFGDRILFENISLGIGEGDRIGLIAKNGAGKTTLLNILAGKENYDSGNIVFRNNLRVGYLEQSPSYPPELTVIQACFQSDNDTVRLIAEYEQALQTDDPIGLQELLDRMDHYKAWDYEQRAKQILSQLKINNFDQPVKELSGGQLKRLALANVLITEPDLLILDEPTNHLDIDMTEWLEEFLRRTNITLLMVTHDRYFLDRVCNQIVEIDNHTLYNYNGNYSYYLEKREERIEIHNAEIDRARNLMRTELDWIRRQPQARGTKAKYRVDAFYELQAKARQEKSDGQVRLEVKSTYIGSQIFEAKGICKKFGDLKIIENFDYTFARYEKMGIVGNNGTGKSTFIKMLVGEIQPDRGRFDIGETVKFGYYSQDGLHFNEQMKVIDAVRDIAEEISLGDGRKLSASQFLQHFLFTPETQHSYISIRLPMCVSMENWNNTVLPIRQISPVRRQSNRPLPITTGITASERRQYIRFWNNSVMTGCFMCLRARSGKRIGMGVFPAITKPGRKPFRSTRTRTASAKIGMFTLWWIVATPDLSISFLRRPGSIIQRNMGRKSRSAKA